MMTGEPGLCSAGYLTRETWPTESPIAVGLVPVCEGVKHVTQVPGTRVEGRGGGSERLAVRDGHQEEVTGVGRLWGSG